MNEIHTLPEKLLSRDVWNISGDFGRVAADTLCCRTPECEIRACCEADESEVFHCTGTLRNCTDRPIVLNSLQARFHLGGGEFEVYTQYNGWQNENTGGWSPLITEAGVSTRSIRTANGAAPMIAVRNRQTGRGVAFHLLADYAWSIRVRRVPMGGEAAEAVVELGVNGENLALPVAPGAEVPTPEVLFYSFANRLDLDCAKLHRFCQRHGSAKPMPVIYNTWLAFFDEITGEKICAQIDQAAQIGAEYFVIDAGWFGEGENWFRCRGDWAEKATGRLQGRLAEISARVRAAGMKFGLWFEIESASGSSNAVQQHPAWFRCQNGQYFLNFANAEARQCMLDTLNANIEKYRIAFIKFDFNQDMDFDDERAAYIPYYRGYEALIDALRAAHPELYLENCASGGLRADLKNGTRFDSFWLSDNQSPYEGMRIFKEGIKRLPPQRIEKWAVIASLPDFAPVYPGHETEKILASHDASWNGIVGAHGEFLRGFLTGSPIGISCDLTRCSGALLELLRAHVAQFKAERAFWSAAVCHILTDTPQVLALEYAAAHEIRLVVYSFKTMQSSLCVYPHVDEHADYRIHGATVSGSCIAANGIEVPLSGNYRVAFCTLERV